MYRAKKGNQEIYLKDDQALTEFLLGTGLKDVVVLSAKNPKEVDFKKFMLNTQKFYSLLKAMSNRYDSDLLYFFISKFAMQAEDILSEKSKTESFLKEFKVWALSNPDLGLTNIHWRETQTGELKQILVETSRYAQTNYSKLSPELAKSSEWTELLTLWNSLQAVSSFPVKVKIDNTETEYETYKALHADVMETTKKGYYIQRYKGLGEMNPEQLWDTTLNPDNRNLLRVSIDDAVAADETFSILMGELVEPRRKFIHDNALSVRALDV